MSFSVTDTMNFIIPFLIAALSGLGIGSGGLLVIWLTEIMGFSQTRARSINLPFFLFSASCALLVHAKRRKLKPSLVLFCAAFGILGTVIGTRIASVTSPEFIRKVFGGMLAVSGIYTLFRRPSPQDG